MKGVVLLVLFYGIISLSFRISIAADSISAYQSISDNQTLVSPGQTFELGFFSPNKSKNRYLGIWYKNISRTIVWVANRNKPITDSSGVLTIGLDGNILVLNGSDNVIWSSGFEGVRVIISTAADTIVLDESLRDGQTLVSSGETFELGFFTPNNSNHRYLGIWYKSISSTIVWVANRNMPLTDSSGVLSIGSDGNIILRNGSESVFWSSNSSRSVEKPIVQLLESGNLVLKDGIFVNSDNYLWQSFDNPSDTMVPGMRQGWDLKTGLNRYLTSWKDIADPSPGDFSYGIDLTGLPQLVLRNRSNKVYRSGIWNGLRFSGLPYFRSNPVYKTTFILNTDEVYYIFEGKDNSIDTRFSVNPWGKLQRFRRDKKSLEWTVMLELPKDQCDIYNFCGPNGICDISMSPVCKCLLGFTPKSQQEWGLLNWTSGCVRTTTLDCGAGDGFEPIKELKLPDMLHYWVNKTMSLKECKGVCMKNCSCTAYTNSDIREGGSGCILWFEDLFDIRQFKESSSDGEQDIYIRVAASELVKVHSTHKKKRRVVITAILSVASAMILLGFTICSVIWKMRRKKGGVKGDKESHKEELEFPLFDFMTIIAATDNFSYTNKIGEGGFGPVYKGKLSEGQEIAVKKLSKDSGQGLAEFKNEMILIAKLQHRNLVKLLGCCIEGEERMLVYEYMPNKSLDYFIFDGNRSKLLTWPKRLNIVMGIARGILYLHQDSRLRIIHRDLKASNILLDSNMNPKISDFGMARMFGGDETEAETKRVVGTYGYMSPEYAIDGHFSVKSDVFSFGVLVLEMVSAKRNRGFYHGEDQHNLVGHAWILWKEGKASQLIDTISLGDSCCVSEALRCIQVGLLCLQQIPEDRPNMLSIVLFLSSESALLPDPKQPGFFVERSSSGIDTTSTEGSSAATLATVSSLEAR